jgi:hypothetical protein
MKRWLTVAVIAMGVAVQVNAQERVLARFEGAIGSTPIMNVVSPPGADGTFSRVTRNVVRGVDPAGPWTIADLRATVRTDGRIRIKGRGLLLANSNRIGETGGQSVFATLICEQAAPFTELSTSRTGVLLSPEGDFEINDTLDQLPPADCEHPVLLIRSANLRLWFAAGIPKSERGYGYD